MADVREGLYMKSQLRRVICENGHMREGFCDKGQLEQRRLHGGVCDEGSVLRRVQTALRWEGGLLRDSGCVDAVAGHGR